MRQILTFTFLFTIPFSVFAQKNWDNVVTQIDQVRLTKHIFELASDKYEGRKTGEKGQHLAARYIQDEFEKYGLIKGNHQSYYQKFHVVQDLPNPRKMRIAQGMKVFDFNTDYYTRHQFTFPKQKLSYIFLGYGIENDEYSDFKNVNMTGKIAVMFMGIPYASKLAPKKYTSSHKIKWAKKYGAKGVIFIHLSEKDYQKGKINTRIRNRYGLSSTILNVDAKEATNFPIYYFNKSSGQSLLKKTLAQLAKNLMIDYNQKKKTYHHISKKMTLQAYIFSNETHNVIGVLEGTSKKLEYIVVTAHYDALGQDRRTIYNGADDNASGVATLLELARVLSKAKKAGEKLERSIVFMALAGEEQGLLGSEYFVNNPVIPIEQMMFNINMDMIGRAKKKSGKHQLYIITNDKKTNEFHEPIAQTHSPKILINQKYNSKDHLSQTFYRSDHYNFYKKGIPFIKYYTGTHQDYHLPTDDAKKINFEGLIEIARLAFWTIIGLSEEYQK